MDEAEQGKASYLAGRQHDVEEEREVVKKKKKKEEKKKKPGEQIQGQERAMVHWSKRARLDSDLDRAREMARGTWAAAWVKENDLAYTDPAKQEDSETEPRIVVCISERQVSKRGTLVEELAMEHDTWSVAAQGMKLGTCLVAGAERQLDTYHVVGPGMWLGTYRAAVQARKRGTSAKGQVRNPGTFARVQVRNPGTSVMAQANENGT